jgi:hypothetical protein
MPIFEINKCFHGFKSQTDPFAIIEDAKLNKRYEINEYDYTKFEIKSASKNFIFEAFYPSFYGRFFKNEKFSAECIISKSEKIFVNKWQFIDAHLKYENSVNDFDSCSFAIKGCIINHTITVNNIAYKVDMNPFGGKLKIEKELYDAFPTEECRIIICAFAFRKWVD